MCYNRLMTNLIVPRTIPWASEAAAINSQLLGAGIKDVKLLYDKNVEPNGIWVVTQLEGQSNIFLLPQSYHETNLKPYILWYCKGDDGRARGPNEQDLLDIIKVVQRAPTIWEKGEKRADEFEALDAKKDETHQKKFKERIHSVAPAMKQAIRKGKL